MQADVYILALLCETVKEKVDPLKVEQWEFYVIPKSEVVTRKGPLTPRSLQERGFNAVSFDGLRAAVRAAAPKAGDGPPAVT